MHHQQQRRSSLARRLEGALSGETRGGRMKGASRLVHLFGVVALFAGLFLPLTSVGQLLASPSQQAPRAQVAQDAVAGAPSQVVAFGDFQSQLGCGDGDVSCSSSTLGDVGGIWSGTFPLAPGSYSVQFAVFTQDGQQLVYGDGGLNGGPIGFSVDDNQLGAWVSWDSHTTDGDAEGVDALYTVQTDLGTFVPEPDGGNLVVLIPSQGGTINLQLLAGGTPVGTPQQVSLAPGWTRVTLDSAGNVIDAEGLTYGTLTVVRLDAQGNPLGGGCYAVEDGGLVNQGCDADDGSLDGATFMIFPEGLDPGSYTIVEVQAPDGAEPIDDTEVSLDAGDNVVQLQPEGEEIQPTEEPEIVDQEPTEEPEIVDEEPTEEPEIDEGEPTEEPGIFDLPTDEPEQDQAPGNLIVTLQDEQGNLIGGACWQLVQGGNVVAESCDIEDANPFNGRAGFFGVPPGDYTLHMSQAPEGVDEPDDVDIEIQPGSEDEEVVTVGLAPTEEPEQGFGDVVVLRQDDQGNEVGGACFVIVDDDGNPVTNEACDEDRDFPDDGRTGFFDVPEGTWWVVETRTPDGHEEAQLTQITVTAGESVDVVVQAAAFEEPTEEPTQEPEPTEEPTLELTEEPEPTAEPTEVPIGNLQVDLYDQDGNLVGGACWQLIQDGNVVAEACDIDGTADRFPFNGKVGLYEIPVGDYILHMSQVPEGHQDPGDQQVTIEQGDALLEVTIQSIDEPTEEATEEPLPTEEPTEVPTEEPTEEPLPTEAPAEEPTAVPTEEPEVTEEPDNGGLGDPGNLVITLQDEDGNNLGGACFELVFDGAVVSTSCDVDDDFPNNGRTGFFNVPSGTYELRQTQDVDGFEPIEPTEVTVDPGLDQTTEVTVVAQASEQGLLPPVDEPTEVPTEEPEDDEAGDEAPTGTGLVVDVTALDASQGPICIELNTQSGISMAGPPAACDNEDGDGDDRVGFILLEDVPPGEYGFFVTSGPDDAVNADWPPVVIEEGTVTQLTLPAGGNLLPEEPTEEPTEFPTEEPTEVPTEVPTEEPTATPEPGAIEIEVRDANDDLVEQTGTCVTLEGLTASVCDNGDGDAENDEGVILIERVPAGTYNLIHDAAPAGFEIGAGLADVSVEEGETTEVELVLEVTPGIVRIAAVDGAGQPLPGACWTLLSGDDEVASQCDDDTNGGIADDGTASMANLAPGEYTLRQDSPPAGFLQVENRTIEVLPGENEPFVVQHEPAPVTIQVNTVGTDGQPLAGACYQLDGGEENCGDGSGTVFFEDAAIGTHAITQSTAPEGFNAEPPQDVEVTPGSEPVVEFVNDEPLVGSVRIVISDEEGPVGQTCAGLIDLVTVCDNQEGDQDGAAGTILIAGVPPGTYNVALSNTPTGIEEPGFREVTVVANEEALVEFDFVLLPPVTAGLRVLVQTGDGTSVANGCVVLMQENEVVYGPVCDNQDGDGAPDEEGVVLFSDVDVGSYAASLTDESTENVEGFQSATSPSVTVEEGADNEATIVVEIEQVETTGTLELITRNNATNQRIPGVCFDLTGASEFSTCDGDASDVNSLGGVIQVNDVPAGEYEAVLEPVPEGYEDPGSRSIEVTGGAFNSYEFRLDQLPQPATLTVLKVDPDDEPLGGSCFSIRQGKVTIQSLCDANDDSPNDGVLVFGDLPASTYLLVETKAPSNGFQLSSPIEFTVTAGQERELTVINYPKPGRVVVTKVDADDATLRLENACFSLQGASDYGPYCDGDDGAVDGRTVFASVAAGTYEVVEDTPPPGYLKADNREITVGPGASVNISIPNEKAPPPEETGDVVVYKMNADDDALPGSCFRLFDGNAPITGQSCDSADGANDGTIRFDDVPVGTWTLRETVRPSVDYQWAALQDVTVQNNQTTEATVENQLKPGRVQVNKTNPEGKPLQNVCFDLQADGKGQQCTDASGVAIFSELEPGTYVLVETQALAGYEPVPNVSNIQVKPGQTTILNVVNERTPPPPNTGSIQVQKFYCPAGEAGERTEFFGGAQGAQQLARTAGCEKGNAVFTLIEDDNEGGPGQFSTGNDGQHQMTLPEGLYRLTEIDPDLEGNSSVGVRINRGQMTTVVVINYLEPPAPEPATIEVAKYTCTPSFDGTFYEDFAQNCSNADQLTNNIAFRIEGPVTQKAVTGDGGQKGLTTFEDLPAGTYTIHEERPYTIPTSYLFCGFDGDWPADWKAVNGSLTVKIDHGETLTCKAFNIAEELTPDTGTILVRKYVCEIENPPKGYNWEEECRLSDQSASFSLAWFNAESQDYDEPVIGQANPDGLLRFTRLEPGTYQLREVDGLWCHAESNSVNAKGDVVVTANRLSEVWIYNCVPPDEPPNTGSGDAASNPPPATLPAEGAAGGPMATPAAVLPVVLLAAWLANRREARYAAREEIDRAA